jgi:aldose 1-epimerase
MASSPGEMFGRTPGDEAVRRVVIRGGGLTASILDWGAVVQDLRLEGHEAPLVLGFDRFPDYPAHSPYFGAIAGRYANRINQGRFEIDGTAVQVDRNFLGRHHLHGGTAGFGQRIWTIADVSGDAVTLTLRDPAGMMGYPGTLEATCRYALTAGGAFSVTLTATCDAPTIVNLAHHSYFNLDDGGAIDCLDHRMMIAAGAYLPVDDEMIPTGVVQPVEGTAFDFRKIRPIRMLVDGAQVQYDHNFCLSASRVPPRPVIRVEGARSGVAMEVRSGEPGVQFYAGHMVAREVPGLGGRRYGVHAGFCLEPQVWPDSPNRPYFPQAVLRPGETYRQETEYVFSRKG